MIDRFGVTGEPLGRAVNRVRLNLALKHFIYHHFQWISFLPYFTSDLGMLIYDHTRSGIEYYEFCELAPAALLFIAVFL